MASKAVIAMSGGVDSTVAAALIKSQGHECTGVTFKLHEPGRPAADRPLADNENCNGSCTEDYRIKDALQAAHQIGIPHHTLNLIEAFNKHVIIRFIETYEAGGTPNPCIDCNRFIKFNRLLFKANGLDVDLLVTGHYARIDKDPGGRWLLRKAADLRKDQSYVLYSLTQDQLEHVCFPLGELTKQEVREIARTHGFENAEKKESQDICFVPDGDYGAFMEAYTGKRYPEGDIIDAEGKILGRHKGIVRYTLGQRRGLGVAANTPVYVSAKNMAANTITLGDESSLLSKTLIARDINLIACDNLFKPLRCMVKTRYLEQEKPALVEQTGPDEIRISFDKPKRAVTPGQAVVFYGGDIVIGGGTIITSL